MGKTTVKSERRLRRKRGIRRKIFGTPTHPRLSVFRSQKHLYVQVIDDVAGKTLASASTKQLGVEASIDAAGQVGRTLAEKARAVGIETVTFDRNGYKYHGRLKALADAAREAGLKF